jgi:hypothetical protein
VRIEDVRAQVGLVEHPLAGQALGKHPLNVGTLARDFDDQRGD